MLILKRRLTLCHALLFKIAKLGITENIFSVVEDMYSSSTIQLKLNNKLTRSIKVLKGTEQGHTLSPELFKCYMQDLSDLLNFDNIPELQDVLISHLLWAEDLVLMALDLETAQKQLDTLHSYCSSWGLEINIAKTKLLIFNKKTLKDNKEHVLLGGTVIETVKSYCYLGINLDMNGLMNPAISDICSKAQ